MKTKEEIFPEFPNMKHLYSGLLDRHIYRFIGDMKSCIDDIIIDGKRTKGLLEFKGMGEFSLTQKHGIQMIGEDGKMYHLAPSNGTICIFTDEKGKRKYVTFNGTNKDGIPLAKEITKGLFGKDLPKL